MSTMREITLDGVTYEVDVDELLQSGLFIETPSDQQDAATPGDLSDDLSEEEEIKTIVEEEMTKALQAYTEALAASHQHEFTYALNDNHTALRGCKCGLAFVGLMLGDVKDLKWHQVHEEL